MGNIGALKSEIARLKSIIEDQREEIKVLTSELQVCHTKEHSISSAITFAMERSNQLENSRRKLYELDLQRSRLLYMRMEQVLTELYKKYPELKKESELKGMAQRFRNAVYGDLNSKRASGYTFASTKQEDPIRKLLNNIITYIDAEHESAKLSRKKDLTDVMYSEYANTPSRSGFDINEALNPTENLEDILKSFNLKKRS